MEKVEQVQKAQTVLVELSKKFKIPGLVQPRSLSDEQYEVYAYRHAFEYLKNEIASKLAQAEAYFVFANEFSLFDECDNLVQDFFLPVLESVTNALDDIKYSLYEKGDALCVEEVSVGEEE